MIEYSVLLPAYRSKEVIGIAIESLINQKVNIKRSWELIICQEEFPEALNLEQKNIIEFYGKRLQNVGCDLLTIVSLKTWIHLSAKWGLMAERINCRSKFIIMQSADCYSQPDRIESTWTHFLRDGAEWVQSKTGYFYDVKSGKSLLYNFDAYPKKSSHICALNMAVKSDLFRYLPSEGESLPVRFVDNYIYTTIRERLGRKLKIAWNESPRWMDGVDLAGVSNISKRDEFFEKPSAPFLVNDSWKLQAHVPPDIYQKILALKAVAGNYERKVWE